MYYLLNIPKRIIAFLILFCNSLFVFGQADNAIAEKFDFIRYDLNKIELPGDSTGFRKIVEKFRLLEESKQGQLNLVHFGGSHVQADMWSSRMRENFNRTLHQEESARGIIFPYRAVKTNGSLQFDVAFNKAWEGFRNVRLTQPEEMGMMGWKATARDSGQFLDVTLKGDTVSSFYFDKLRIFHEVGGAIFPFTVMVDDSIYQPVYIDSCRCSEVVPILKSKRFVLTVHKTDTLQTEFVLQGIQTLLNQPGLTYHSIGVNGASVKSFLNCKLLEQQLAFLQPDLIIFSIGINDSFDKDFSRESFEASYRELIRRIRTTCPDVEIIFITNTDSYKNVKRHFYKNLKGNEVKHSMFSLAKEHNAAVWDLFSIMGGMSSISKWKRHTLAQRDLIHLTRKGYFLVGDLLFDAFIQQQEVVHQNP